MEPWNIEPRPWAKISSHQKIHIWILLWQIWEYFLNSEKLWHQAWTAPKRFPKIWAQALQKWPVPGWTWAGTRAQPITKSGSTMYIAKCCIMFVYLCMFVKYFDDQQYLQDLKLKTYLHTLKRYIFLGNQIYILYLEN